jgi:hypothetical protein
VVPHDRRNKPMPTQSIFKVYLSQPLRGEFALVIVTGQRESHNFLSEYFAFVHSPKRKQYCKRFVLDNAEWLQSQFDRTPENECDDSLVAAQAALDGYILEKYESTKDPYYATKLFELRQIPEIRMLTYWMQDLFNEELRYLYRFTKCDPLREFLVKVLQAPKFRESDIPRESGTA